MPLYCIKPEEGSTYNTLFIVAPDIQAAIFQWQVEMSKFGIPLHEVGPPGSASLVCYDSDLVINGIPQ